jgi:hypothetical protein
MNNNNFQSSFAFDVFPQAVFLEILKRILKFKEVGKFEA